MAFSLLAMLSVAPPFNGDRAAELLERQVSFGPRVPGSEAHDRMLRWLTGTLKGLAPEVQTRPFILNSPLTGERVRCTNVLASFRPERKDRIFFGAHWDSRAYADRDPDPAKWKEPVPGANDGASGVAVLLTLAEVMKKSPPPLGVDLVFFDGEDQGKTGEPSTFCHGARSFAASAALTGFSPRFGVVIDLVGDENAQFRIEKHSFRCCPELMESVLRILERNRPEMVDRGRKIEIYDDHVPFAEAGIPCVLLFGGGGPRWHTTADLPQHCSAQSLSAIGGLLLDIIYIYGEQEMP